MSITKTYNNLVTELKTHCQANYPLECCGLITLDYEFVPCENISTYPKESFILDPGMLMRYDNNIWGLYHSHPGDSPPYPSKQDNHTVLLKDYKFLVSNTKEVFIYWYDEEGKNFVIDKFEEKHLC